MRYRDPKKESDLFSMIEHQQSVLKAVKGSNKLNAVIDRKLFREDLESILGYESQKLDAAFIEAGRSVMFACLSSFLSLNRAS